MSLNLIKNNNFTLPKNRLTYYKRNKKIAQKMINNNTKYFHIHIHWEYLYIPQKYLEASELK